MTTRTRIEMQDLPPKGGYAPYQIDRIQLRTIVGGRLGLAALYISTAVGAVLYHANCYEYRRNEIEMRSSRLAVEPLLEAERDRALMKRMREIAIEEADLMKDVPEWELGTYFGEPVFLSLPPEKFVKPTRNELNLHSHVKDYSTRFYLRSLT
ncbi:NADH dehydrogenase [ubiquinone] 1 alpha subcomplex subunit 13 [Colletes gigas]|uniref:NADH dehydrogenase [ubiquinone] 1 alpha subcomplex subunit 13 n=1 Tax=Colletes gigas TaxID=935657 RepID=UPI001C9B8F69|nr:NADH dehydrogenase [ubiquinone] 1 alpha subcomplex subunit 13 [Colletes gigas]